MLATEPASGATQGADACVDGTYGELGTMHASCRRAVAMKVVRASPAGSTTEDDSRLGVRSTNGVLWSDQHDLIMRLSSADFYENRERGRLHRVGPGTRSRCIPALECDGLDTAWSLRRRGRWRLRSLGS